MDESREICRLPRQRSPYLVSRYATRDRNMVRSGNGGDHVLKQSSMRDHILRMIDIHMLPSTMQNELRCTAKMRRDGRENDAYAS